MNYNQKAADFNNVKSTALAAFNWIKTNRHLFYIQPKLLNFNHLRLRFNSN